MNSATSVSVVIPTRNRPESLLSLLTDLSKQAYPLSEVIIVDSSDQKVTTNEIQSQFPSLQIRYMVSVPSVCIQRNLGIQSSKTLFVLICDDDISLPPDYVSVLMNYLKKSNACAASGLVLQKGEQNKWHYQYPPKSFLHLMFVFIFQQSVWGNVTGLKVGILNRPIYGLIKMYYEKRKNALSLAGWPILTDFSGLVFRTTIYGLGASIVKRDWLLNSSYDEVLDAHGIGDNYGVAIGFPEERAIHVVTEAKALHYQNEKNRLNDGTVYFRRLLALHYFLKRHKKTTWLNRLWFMWSLVGNAVFHKAKDHRKATKVALMLIAFGNNPYLLALKEGEKVIEPDF